MSSFFSGKVIWITGASSGIGEALVHELASKGAKIVLSARHEDKLKRVASAAGLTHENSLIVPLDLSALRQPEKYVSAVLQKFSRIDILINNGGISQRGEALQTAEEVERHLFEINYFGHVSLTKAVLPVMIRQKSGYIAVISSIAGKFGFYLRSTYSAAKHALHGYFESLRLENEKHNIHVLMACPGKINTQISLHAINAAGGEHAKTDASHQQGMSARTCAQRILYGIEQEKKELLIGGKELWAVRIKRFFPGLFYRIIRKQKAE
jgi:short-subunit dehydrogenase